MHARILVTHNRKSGLAALAVMLAAANPALAQEAVEPAPRAVAGEEEPIDFAANTLEYDNEADIVTATGDVTMTREGNRVRADQISWNRRTGRVLATGNVSVTNPGGDVAYGDSIELTDTLKDGAVENLLIVLTDGGRLAAVRGNRANGVSTLDRAIYSPCRVEDEHGCTKNPVWKITAVRVVHDPVKNRIRYKNAQLEIFGLPFLHLKVGSGDVNALPPEAVARRGDEAPTLRLANLLFLAHNLSVDRYVESVIVHAKLVVVRLLGGVRYWPYGVEQLARFPDKGFALPIFLFARRFADHHPLRLDTARSEHGLDAAFAQTERCASLDGSAQLRPVHGVDAGRSLAFSPV